MPQPNTSAHNLMSCRGSDGHFVLHEVDSVTNPSAAFAEDSIHLYCHQNEIARHVSEAEFTGQKHDERFHPSNGVHPNPHNSYNRSLVAPASRSAAPIGLARADGTSARGFLTDQEVPQNLTSGASYTNRQYEIAREARIEGVNMQEFKIPYQPQQNLSEDSVASEDDEKTLMLNNTEYQWADYIHFMGDLIYGDAMESGNLVMSLENAYTAQFRRKYSPVLACAGSESETSGESLEWFEKGVQESKSVDLAPVHQGQNGARDGARSSRPLKSILKTSARYCAEHDRAAPSEESGPKLDRKSSMSTLPFSLRVGIDMPDSSSREVDIHEILKFDTGTPFSFEEFPLHFQDESLVARESSVVGAAEDWGGWSTHPASAPVREAREEMRRRRESDLLGGGLDEVARDEMVQARFLEETKEVELNGQSEEEKLMEELMWWRNSRGRI